MNVNAQAVREYFERIDKVNKANGDYSRNTDVGIFAPSSLTHLEMAFQRLVDEGSIDTAKYVSDAGCGDGRVIALLAAGYQLPTVGVEYDPEIADRARTHLTELKKLSILNGTPAVVATGDFTLDGTYSDAGINFGDIGTFFNYINGQGQIAAKIAQQSPAGTKFLLYDSRPTAEEFSGLTLERSLELVDNSRMIQSWDFTDLGNPKQKDPVPHTAYLHVHTK